MRMQEHELKLRALRSLIVRRVLEEEARKKGVALESLIENEVSARIAEPGEAELRSAYEQKREQYGKPFDEVRGRVREEVREGRAEAARRTYFVGVWQAAGARILLDPPRISVSADRQRIRGNPAAPVMIVEFSDFQCPYCRRVQATLNALLEKYPGQVAVSFRDYPVRELHPQAHLAAEAARCAGAQGKFWEFHDELFLPSAPFGRAAMSAAAEKLALDLAAFDACVDGGAFRQAVLADFAAGNRAGVSGTPAFFINGVFLGGALPQADFERVIDRELERLGHKPLP
jgi:protein-disulfide isomerase